jgi:hypothetical protein
VKSRLAQCAEAWSAMRNVANPRARRPQAVHPMADIDVRHAVLILKDHSASEDWNKSNSNNHEITCKFLGHHSYYAFLNREQRNSSLLNFLALRSFVHDDTEYSDEEADG